MRNKTSVVVVLILVVFGYDVMAQNTFSPYTIKGIGDLSNMSLSSHFAMGEVGIGTPSVWHINNLNPALLPYNTLTSFQLGVGAESRTVSSQTQSQKSGSGGIRYMAFAFPIMPSKWTSSFGFLPYSSVNYNVTSQDVVQGTAIPVTILKVKEELPKYIFQMDSICQKVLPLASRLLFFLDLLKMKP
jgi:hypothetical protein